MTEHSPEPVRVIRFEGAAPAVVDQDECAVCKEPWPCRASLAGQLEGDWW